MIFPYTAREQRLRAYIGTLATVRLYAKKVRLSTKSAAAHLVEAPASIGYLPIKLAMAAWRFEPSGTSVRAVTNDVAWRFTAGGATIHGHYALDRAGLLLWVEALEEPCEVLRANDEFQLLTLAIEDVALEDHA